MVGAHWIQELLFIENQLFFSHCTTFFFQAKYSSVQSFQKVTWVSRGDLYFGFTQLYGTVW